MTSFNLGKILQYFKIQENLRSENLTKYYLCKEIFLFFYTLKDIIKAQSKTNHCVSLKAISDECFSFNVNVNASLKVPLSRSLKSPNFSTPWRLVVYVQFFKCLNDES